MKHIVLAALLIGAAPALANTTPAQRGEPNTTAAQRAQAVENDDFDEWGLLGLLGLAGLLGLRRRNWDHKHDNLAYEARDRKTTL
jgi:MYXO-CTERM domain-containing protein